jgi:DNA-binding IclR family transcriptional regulator
MAGKSPLGSVDKALRALQRLGDAGAGGLPLTRLAADLGLIKSSVHRTLAALRHRGFVEQDQNGNYRLGPSLLAIADSHLRDESLRGLIHEALAMLCARAGETCHLGVLAGEQVVYIDKVEPQRAIRIWSEIGWRNPALTTALGRAILSQKYVDFASFSAAFPGKVPRRTAQTRTSLKQVWQELMEARRRGFTHEEQENEPGVTCIAVAILRGAQPLAAISITAPVERMDTRRQNALAQTLHACIGAALPPGLTLQRAVPDAVPRSRAGARPIRKGTGKLRDETKA